MISTLMVLKAARALIAEKSGWTRRTYARDIHDKSVLPSSVEATCFCSYGAIERGALNVIGQTSNIYNISDAEGALRNFIPDGMIADFNDNHTHAEVLAVFDLAIAAQM